MYSDSILALCTINKAFILNGGKNRSFLRHVFPPVSLAEELIITMQSSFLEDYLEGGSCLFSLQIFLSLKLDSLNVSFTGAEHTVMLNPGEK